MNYCVKRAIGLMSGTSFDGVDGALIETDGIKIVSRGPYEFVGYEPAEQTILQDSMQTMGDLSDNDARLALSSDAASFVTKRHIEVVEALMEKSGLTVSDVDVIGFHGQTLFHDAAQGFTLQAGSGAELAAAVGIDVVHDFRSNDLKAGGQGAPLVPVYHQALCSEAGIELPVVIVNIGGVANITYIGSGNELLAFDTGPGNGLLNDWVRNGTGAAMDEGGRIAAVGNIDQDIVDEFLSGDYFKATPPKSLDRHDFNLAALEGLSLEDGAATLTEMTARSIAQAAEFLPGAPLAWIVVGGGALNPQMMARLGAAVSAPVKAAVELGWEGSFVEAEAFGFLAVRHLFGLPLTFPGTTGVKVPTEGGRMVEV